MQMAKFFQQSLQLLNFVYQALRLTVLRLYRRRRTIFSRQTAPKPKSTDLRVRSQHFSAAAKTAQRTNPRYIRAISLQPVKLRKFWRGFSLALLLGLTALLLHSHHSVNRAEAALTIPVPLSTRGSQIVDASGKPILLRGVNWFGIETENHAPHGLWARDYKEMLSQIKSLGYNIIRLPYSVQALKEKEVTGIDFSIGSNNELEGKTPLEVMDLIVQEAQRQGLLVLLDSHQLNNKRIPELWYGDGFSEADWIDAWKMLATRYKNQANVIGADLKNEPHGRASWGTGDRQTDWRLAAERAGNAILSINPNWLIVVEGVENNVPGQKLPIHWMGGNLEGVKRYPVRLSVKNKLVYSPHEYGPGVFDQPWFSEASFPNNLERRWEIGFNYIARQKIAPVLIGEFGGRQVDSTSKEGIWQRKLVNFINREKLSFTYWSWNPNSGDTGGILQEDWLNVEQPKQELLSTLLPRQSALESSPRTPSSQPSVSRDTRLAKPSSELGSPRTPSPQPSVRVQPSTSETPRRPERFRVNQSAPSRLKLKTETNIQSDWQSGFCVSMRVTNQGNTKAENWQLKFRMNQAAINNSWNGSFAPQGSQYVVTPPDWGRVLEPNQTVDMGFCANKLGTDYQPQNVSALIL
jgi:endoglucanase